MDHVSPQTKQTDHPVSFSNHLPLIRYLTAVKSLYVKPWFHFLHANYFSSIYFNLLKKNNKKKSWRKGWETHSRVSYKWCSVDNCQKTLQCWLPCKPDMAVTTVTGSGWGYKLDRLGYFRVTKRGHRKSEKKSRKVKISLISSQKRWLKGCAAMATFSNRPVSLSERRSLVPLQVHQTDLSRQLYRFEKGKMRDPSILTYHWDLLSKLLNI